MWAYYPEVVLRARGPQEALAFMESFRHADDMFLYQSSQLAWVMTAALACLQCVQPPPPSPDAPFTVPESPDTDDALKRFPK